MKYILLGTLFLVGCEKLQKPGDNARAAAHTWAQNLYPGADIRVSCADWDSDGDGYVSCTAVVNTPSFPQTFALECASGYALTGGCRLQKPAVLNNGRTR